MGADPAARRTRLRHCLHLYRFPAICRPGADAAARGDRLECPGLLVPADPLARWRHRDADPRALSLCLPAVAAGLPLTVGLRARGQPYAGPRPLAQLISLRLALAAPRLRPRRPH